MFVGISAGRLGARITKVPFTKDASGRIYSQALHAERALRPVKHPRWYASHGALQEGSKAFEEMVEDYKEAIA